MSVQYKKVSDFEPGILYALLEDAYAFDPRYRQYCAEDWREFDAFFFDNPHIAGKCGFVTTLGDEAIGFVSWDPRNMPEYAIIGHNCIAAKYKGNGYGKAQLREAVNRILKNVVRKIVVTTNDDLIPAQRMYEGVGFTVIKRRECRDDSGATGEHIDYVLLI